MPTRKRTRRAVLKALSRPSMNNAVEVSSELWLSGIKMCAVCGTSRPRPGRGVCVDCYELIASGVIEIFTEEDYCERT